MKGPWVASAAIALLACASVTARDPDIERISAITRTRPLDAADRKAFAGVLLEPAPRLAPEKSRDPEYSLRSLEPRSTARKPRWRAARPTARPRTTAAR